MRKKNNEPRNKFLLLPLLFLIIAILQPGYPFVGEAISAVFRVLPIPVVRQELMAPKVIYSVQVKKTGTQILDQIISYHMSDADKVKAVHDYIVLNTEYDYDNYNNKTIPKESFTVEGVLDYGKAVCQGYAYTFQMFMELLDIESKLVVGYDKVDGVAHAWNMVHLGDEWYHVDVTWDDPVTASGKGMIQYQYFLVTDLIMEEEHQWEQERYPACISNKYQYFPYQDNMVDSIDQYEAEFMEQYNHGQRNITVLYPEEGYPDFQFLIRRGLVKKDSSGRYVIIHNALKQVGDYTMLTVILEE